MNDDVTRTHPPRSGAKSLRLPLLMVTALMSMGSGMGNPGCGDDERPTTCERGCAVSGTYVMRFQDTTSLGPDCGMAGVILPEGEQLILNREGNSPNVTARLGSVGLIGEYFGTGYGFLTLRAGVQVQGREEPLSELEYTLDGYFDHGPTREDEAVKFIATFSVSRVNVPEGAPGCVVSRRFTATR
ncbi:hypothetical protein [Myxococcus landrumensis]|uniref:Lipoprotein n=1 Tax=Myxococcus landrumensis TaxID=2813577 RepID=A0ABX7NEV7_9BACT|nr:hypothetical protein [Myxococcus landrumus]QSQ14813.1 hypothetical protein JY572_01605 [Myxococcus landrumus]